MNGALPTRPVPRLASIDAYRGWVMFLMLAEVLQLSTVATALPNSAFWRFLAGQQTHAPWVGCSLHDLIQPGFSFLVGVALPFSIAHRQARGQTHGAMTRHAAIRAFLLVLLGIVLSAPGRIFWEFTDTLAQLGLGDLFVFLLAFRPPRDGWLALGMILAGYWLAFALYPLPPPDFDYAKANVPAGWLAQHGLTGFATHWQKNSHLAWAFDTWFLNLFPREAPFTGHPQGLVTLSFIPLIATMILGLVAGRVLRSTREPWAKVRWLAIAGGVGLSLGWALGALGICPVAKPIWTPSWVLFSGGWCFLFLGAFYALVDVWQKQWFVQPLVVIGMNSLAAYGLAKLYPAFAFNSVRRVVGSEVFRCFGEAFEPLVYGLVILAGYWLVLFLLYRRKIFLRI